MQLQFVIDGQGILWNCPQMNWYIGLNKYIGEHKNKVLCRGWANVTFLHSDLQEILKYIYIYHVYKMKGTPLELVSENMSDF